MEITTLRHAVTVFVVFMAIISFTSMVQGDDRIPKCSFTQSCIRDASQKGSPCPDPTNTETPIAQVGFPKMPSSSIKYLAEACPYLLDQELCCNDDQILNMYNNFKTIDSLFGNWLICSINLKRFWWEYTCSPYQFYFLDSHDQVRVPDVDYLVLNQTMRIENSIAWDIYNSWNKNPYVATLASGQSAPGFLEFMGSNAVQSGKVKISFNYNNNPDVSLIKNMYACDMEVGDTLEGYKVEECTCNYWEQAWKPNESGAYPEFFDGFDWLLVLLVYITVLILSVIIFFVKRKWQIEEDDEISVFSDDSQGNENLKNMESSQEEVKERLINVTTSENVGVDSFGKINSSSMDVSVGVNDNQMS